MKTMKYIGFLILALSLIGCDKLPLQRSYDYDPKPLDPHQYITCWEYIEQDSRLASMKTAVERCALTEYYSQTAQKYTYLLLDETAFTDYILPQLEAASIEEADTEAMKEILLFHIIRGEYNGYIGTLSYDPSHVLTLWEDLDAVMTIKLYNDFDSLSQKLQDRVTFMDQCGHSTVVYATMSNLLMTNGSAHILSRNCVYEK